MGVFDGLFSILEGKEDAARTRGRDDRSSTGGVRDIACAIKITRETWAMQETPMGSFMLVWFESEDDVEKVFGNLAGDNSEFSTWFRAQVKHLTGVDLGVPPKGPLPAVLVNWHA